MGRVKAALAGGAIGHLFLPHSTGQLSYAFNDPFVHPCGRRIALRQFWVPTLGIVLRPEEGAAAQFSPVDVFLNGVCSVVVQTDGVTALAFLVEADSSPARALMVAADMETAAGVEAVAGNGESLHLRDRIALSQSTA